MIVPRYWAEARLQQKEPKRQVTVRRFGWSNESEADAQVMADERAQEAMQRIWRGEKLPRRELKESYGGALGMPIREEILEQRGDTIITRNSYGARCLNTPNVFFADVDFEREPPAQGWVWISLLLLAGPLLLPYVREHWWLLGLLAIAAGIQGYDIAKWWALRGFDREAKAFAKVRAFAQRHSDWRLRLYRTPAGLRLLALHRTFAPDEPAVLEAFQQLGGDAVYGLMCQHQQCFRARVTAKPWRIGINQDLRPRPGVWPVHPDRLPERQRWVAEYEQKATAFAACKYLETLGDGRTDPTARAVQEWHDALAKAESGLPVA